MDVPASKGSLRESEGRKRQFAAVDALREMLITVRKQILFAIIFSGCFFIQAKAQQHAVPVPQTGAVSGTVTDVNDAIVPGADVILQNSVTGEKRSTVSGDDGSYIFSDLQSGVTYYITISARGFVTWTSPDIIVSPDQDRFLVGCKLQLVGQAISITVYASSEHTAAEQVQIEERQRVFGVFPNFYVVYDHNAEPLTAKLKFKLALKASADLGIFAAVAFTAAVEQAGHTPNYRQGAKGYGQRMGALYTNGFTDIMVGEAILPSVLHQDPRYFYQGTGTTRSRAVHALSSAFICKGDNGKWEPNYSSIGGDLTAGAISNIYYPRSNRGVGIVFNNALTTAGGRMVNGIVQEFILHEFTPGTTNRTP